MPWWLLGVGVAVGIAFYALRDTGSNAFAVIVDSRPSNVGSSTIAEIGRAVESAVQSQLPGATFLGMSVQAPYVYHLYRGGRVAPGLTSTTFSEAVTRWIPAVALSNLHVAGVRAVLGSVTAAPRATLSGLPRMATGRRR